VLQTLVLWMLMSIVLVLAALGVAFGVFSWQLQRRNRVDPHTETLAPLLWLWSPTQPARMHRRLQRAAVPLRVIDAQDGTAPPRRRTRRSTTPEPPVGSAAGLRRSVMAQAVELDRQVAITARQPRPVRRQALRALGAQVTTLEATTARLVRLHVQASAPPAGPRPAPASPPEVLGSVNDHLDLLSSRRTPRCSRSSRRTGCSTRRPAATRLLDPPAGRRPPPDRLVAETAGILRHRRRRPPGPATRGVIAAPAVAPTATGPEPRPHAPPPAPPRAPRAPHAS
jgi:hypothetical protein